MTQYFCLISKNFEDLARKFKSGTIYELTAEDAANLNRLMPGMLESYVPDKHTPAPVLGAVEEAKEEAKPVIEAAETKEEEAEAEVAKEKKAKKTDKPAA